VLNKELLNILFKSITKW